MGETETDCRKVLSDLYAYIDGETSMIDCAALEAHLAACGDCLSHADFERDVKQIVRRACGQADMPEGLEAKIRGLLQGH